MTLRSDQRLERLQTRQRELSHWRIRDSLDIDGWRCNGGPIALGAPWPTREGLVSFAAQGALPKDWALEDARLSLDLGGESLLTLRYEDGSQRFLRPRRQSSDISARRAPLRH